MLTMVMVKEQTPRRADDDGVHLVRGLTLPATTALVVGTVIGTGVFIKTAIMAQDTGSATMVLLAWIAAGVLSMCGALTYAELGAMLPHAGGEYVYLRQAYGELAAFLFGWMRFVVAGTGSIAILGVGFATFLSAIVPMTSVWASSRFTLLGQTIDWQFGSKQIVAVAAIVLLRGDQLPDGGFRRPRAIAAHRAEARRHRRGRGRRVRRLGHGRLVTPRRDRHGEQQRSRQRSASPCSPRSGPMTVGTTCRWRPAR